MKKATSKKLNLSKATVINLSKRQQQKAKGGEAYDTMQKLSCLWECPTGNTNCTTCYYTCYQHTCNETCDYTCDWC